MSDVQKMQKQTPARAFFRALSPASWFGRKKEEKASPAPKLDPEFEMRVDNMYIGAMIGGLIPTSRKYGFGKNGEARKKIDIAGVLVLHAKDSFGAMERTSKASNPALARMYSQYYHNATENLKDAVKIYSYAAALLADGSELKRQANEKIADCISLAASIDQYHNASSGRREK